MNILNILLNRNWLPHFFAFFTMILSSALLQAESEQSTGEVLIPLKLGEAGILSYGLYSVSSGWRGTTNASPGSSLLLVLRNIGAKSINMGDVTASDFTIRDSRGQSLRIHLWSQPRTMGYGD